MIGSLTGRVRSYAAVAGMVPKLYVAYRAWFWAQLFVQILALTIFVYFWRAVYAELATIGGLSMRQSLNYLMWGQILLPMVQSTLVYRFGDMLVDGQFAVELLFIALNLIAAVSAFWIVESIPFTQSVFEMNEFAKFPLSIYPRAIGILLTWLIPYGFASFYPASHLLGRDVGALAWLGLPVAAALLFLGYRFWCFGLRHYASTGS